MCVKPLWQNGTRIPEPEPPTASSPGLAAEIWGGCRGGLRSQRRVLRSLHVSVPREALLRVVRDVIAPLVRADQGELYLVGLSDERVSLHLGGRYSGCPGNTLARRRVIEPALHAVAPDAEIIITSGALIPAQAERLT